MCVTCLPSPPVNSRLTVPLSGQSKSSDLLLLDAGDLHDGTGLVDGVPAGEVPGVDAMRVLGDIANYRNEQGEGVGWDVMAIGKCVLSFSLSPSLGLCHTFSLFLLHTPSFSLDAPIP